MRKVPVDLAPEVRASGGRHPRSAAAEVALELAREYRAARRRLWAAGGVSFRARLRVAAPESDFARGDDSPAAFEAAALQADGGFAVSRQVPGVERELAAAIKARNALVVSSLPLAQRYVSRRGQGQGRNASGLALHADGADLLQGACEMLLRAADRFDPDRGCAWSTYAVWWLRYGAQLEELAAPTVRVPKKALALWREAEALRGKMAAETGQAPTLAEVAEALGKPPGFVAAVEAVERALRSTVCEAQEVGEVDAFAGTNIAERCIAVAGLAAVADPQPTPETALARAEVLGAVRAMMDAACGGERAVLAGFAGEGSASLEAAARAEGAPRSRAPEIRRRAVEGARSRLARVA